MEQAIREPQHHRYPAGRGDLGFRKQIAAFFRDRYGVSLDPRDEILVIIGSKEGLGAPAARNRESRRNSPDS